MKRLIEELKRRHVLRAAAYYAAGAWLLVQVATQVFPFFDIPNWTVRLVVVAVIAGFPFAVAISWFYEWTPQGFRREAEPGQPAPGPASGRGVIGLVLAAVGGVVAAVLIAAWLVTRGPPAAPAEPAVSPLSIAVLPFRNLSSNADNAYFAEGIQDEILTRLTRIGALKVISRTSTAHYASAPADLPKIASELSVDNIVEGSVQRHDDDVRINVQLIKAGKDSNIWSETYDRKLTDVFGVESEVARAIAESLKAKLTGEEQRSLDVTPTQNAGAYDQYLRGLAFDLRSFEPANFSSAAVFLRRAVQLDPQFALAWARLSRVDANLVYQGIDTGRCDQAGQEAATALRLRPDLGEAHLAQGYYHYLCRSDLAQAQASFETARLDLPGSAEVLEAMGRIERRRGDWKKAVDYMQQAVQLDPRNTALLGNYALTLVQMRQFDPALSLSDKALDVQPDDASLVALQVYVYQAQGNLDSAQRLLDAFGPHLQEVDVFDYQILQQLYRRQYAPAIAQLNNALAQDLSQIGEGAGDYYYLLGVAQGAAGDAAGAHRAFESGRAYLQRFRKREHTTDNDMYVDAQLCLMDAGAGADGSPACQATQQLAASDSPFAPSARETLARADAMRGRVAQATALLPELLQAHYYSFLYSAPLTPQLLRLDPVWDPLRGDARFQELSGAPASGG